MTRTPIRHRTEAGRAPAAIARHRALIDDALRACVGALEDPQMRRIASYQMGWTDADGRPSPGHAGKALRPTLVLVAAEAAGAAAERAVGAAAAVELVHNFSLLHDDVMDGDHERRHRPTGWAAFGEGPALLAGNAMLVAATELLLPPATGGAEALGLLLRATQRLISGQAEDLRLEAAPDADLAAVLHMSAGKTGALLECSAALGAVVAGADQDVVHRLAGYGRELGLAFQLVDDVLGLIGEPEVTGKPRGSDLRAGKRTAPIVAALRSGTAAGDRLDALLREGPPVDDDEVGLASHLVDEAGGLDWALAEADARRRAAVGLLADDRLAPAAVADLRELADFVVDREL